MRVITLSSKISETQQSTWRNFWTQHKDSSHSMIWYSRQFGCSWGTARDHIQGNQTRGGRLVGFENEPTLIPIEQTSTATYLYTPTPGEIDPMETLIQTRLILIEVSLASKGLLARCTTLAQGIETAIAALHDVHQVSTLLDTNEELNDKLNAAEHGLVAANSYIEELKARLGMSH